MNRTSPDEIIIAKFVGALRGLLFISSTAENKDNIKDRAVYSGGKLRTQSRDSHLAFSHPDNNPLLSLIPCLTAKSRITDGWY